MQKFTILFSLLFLIAGITSAQEEAADPNAWQTSVEFSVGLTQATYSDNWTGGEVGSLIWTANLHATAAKKISSKWKNENDLKLAFGQTHNQIQETKKWQSPLKSTDKIRFDSILKYTPEWFLDPYIAFIFQSQFYDDATTPDEKHYVNPIELTESIGGSRTLYESETRKANTRLGFGLRQYLFKVYDPAADETSNETTYDGGIEWVTDWTEKLSETLNYTTKLSVFQALFYSESDEEGVGDEWQTTDVAWENILTAKVIKIVQVSLAWELLYDEQVSKAGRFKETLSMGVAWVF